LTKALVKEDSRADLVAKAAKARGKGRRSDAIGYYSLALQKEPDRPDLRAKLAHLLAQASCPDEALVLFASATKLYIEKGFMAARSPGSSWRNFSCARSAPPMPYTPWWKAASASRVNEAATRARLCCFSGPFK
jgi:hypothetical protein